jgi:hypothetical protein
LHSSTCEAAFSYAHCAELLLLWFACVQVLSLMGGDYANIAKEDDFD